VFIFVVVVVVVVVVVDLVLGQRDGCLPRSGP